MIYRLSVERKKFLVIFIRGMIKCPRKGLKFKIKAFKFRQNKKANPYKTN